MTAGQGKVIAALLGILASCRGAAFGQTDFQPTVLPFRITAIRRIEWPKDSAKETEKEKEAKEQPYCEVVIEGRAADPAEGYALVVGVNSTHPFSKIRAGVIENASAKDADLCKVISGTVKRAPSGALAVWEMIGLADKPAGVCPVMIPDEVDMNKMVRVKAQLFAYANGKWIEQSKPFEKAFKPTERKERRPKP